MKIGCWCGFPGNRLVIHRFNNSSAATDRSSERQNLTMVNKFCVGLAQRCIFANIFDEIERWVDNANQIGIMESSQYEHGVLKCSQTVISK